MGLEDVWETKNFRHQTENAKVLSCTIGEGSPGTNHDIVRPSIWKSQTRFLENSGGHVRVSFWGSGQSSNGETGPSET
jgi:hypothetical protein